MKKIIQAQATSVNDTCNTCGSFVDIGAVIDEHDTLMQMTFAGENALAQANEMAKRATTRFASANAQINRQSDATVLGITFSCTAEKMIFQLENSL